MSVRDPGAGPRTSSSTNSLGPVPTGPRTATPSTSRRTAGPAIASGRPGPAGGQPRPAVDRPRSKPDPTAARLAIGALGFAATTALVAAIAGGTSAALAAGPSTFGTAPAALAAPVAAVPVRHVTKVVTLPSNVTPPPRKIIYATPVPAPPQQTVIVRTTQSGTIVP